jgi:hypothetical protein
MTQVYRTLRVAPSDKGVLGVVIGAPPMNLIGPELVHDLVGLVGALDSDQETRVGVLQSADPDYFVPHVDLTKVAEYGPRHGGDSRRGRLQRRTGRTVRLDQPGPAGRRPGRVRGPARAAHRIVPRRRGALFTQGLQTRGPLELDLGDCIEAL